MTDGRRPALRMPPLRRALGLAALGGRRLLATHMTLVVVQGLVPVASIWTMKLVVDAVTAGTSAADRAAAFDALLVAVGIAAAVLLAGQVVREVSGLVGELHGERVGDRVAQTIHAHAVALDLADFEDPAFHDALERAHVDGPQRPVRIVATVAGLARAAVTALGMIALIGSLHWAVPIVVAAASVPAVVVRMRAARRLLAWQLAHTQDMRAAAYFGGLLTSPQAAKDVRAFRLGAPLAARQAELRARLRGERFALSVARGRGELLAQLLSLGVVAGAYVWLGALAIEGVLTLGALVLQAQAVQRLQGSIGEVLGGGARLVEDGMFLDHYFAFLARRPRVVAQEPVHAVQAPLGEIRFEGVVFTYPGQREPALRGVDLVLRPGERVALVGSNGAGKSTLVRLLCRLHDPSEGRITCGGVDLRHFAPDEWRRRLAVLFQDAVPIEVSARENIAFGDVDAARDVVPAARLAGIDERLATLPRGYDTTIGQRFAGGAELSVGERRMLLLARVLHRDAELVVLDEPSASLDPRNEVQVFERLRAAAPQRTLLFVTHRPAPLAFADRVVVLERGQVREQGAAAELATRGGAFARLFPPA